MKICAIICEYNPFHNGHLYQMQQAKLLSGADAILCIMSGNFVQRGEMAIMDKFTRAKHALMAGADVVIELPAVFATSNAELFAKGAIHILRYIPAVTTLCFGAEIADKEAFLKGAKLLNEEPKEVSKKLQALLSEGMSYAKARAQAFGDILPQGLLTSPNNILGLEYTRAILNSGANIDILPIPRIGKGYKEQLLNNKYPSATGIRSGIEKGEQIVGVPDFVLSDLPNTLENCLDALEKYAILSRGEREIIKVCDCVEGLENAFKRAAENPAPLVEQLTSARYTSSRIRRIALQNLLNIDEELIRESLRIPLYLRVLAIKKANKKILSALSDRTIPLLIRAYDEEALSQGAWDCYEKDIFAEKVYGLLNKNSTSQKTIFL